VPGILPMRRPEIFAIQTPGVLRGYCRHLPANITGGSRLSILTHVLQGYC
jgi:hypothetical protein